MSKLINANQTINIADITGTETQDRIRENYKDIKALSKDIKQNGQMVPIWLTEDLKLIAGGRRLEALKLLKKDTVRADIYHVDNEYDKFCLEVKENLKRDDFSVAETAKAMKIMLEKERELAEKKRLANLKQGDSPSVRSSNTRENNTDQSSEWNNSSTREDGRAENKVAKEFGVSRFTLRRMIEIYENKNSLPPEDYAKWDAGKFSTNKMYNILHPKPKTDNSSNLKPKTKEEPKAEPAASVPAVPELEPQPSIRPFKSHEKIQEYCDRSEIFKEAWDMICDAAANTTLEVYGNVEGRHIIAVATELFALPFNNWLFSNDEANFKRVKEGFEELGDVDIHAWYTNFEQLKSFFNRIPSLYSSIRKIYNIKNNNVIVDGSVEETLARIEEDKKLKATELQARIDKVEEEIEKDIANGVLERNDVYYTEEEMANMAEESEVTIW